eukprot:TRINITY_DN3416_c0_g1_i1.p1 TRINITY_DN3416_c0_g1~~TRINITY_DN3416_c0_g1_i1.p1  ORF type:complete len:175 (+),score=53.76 TRINITY_DN3416_c0_g1_i1:100-624(+)
MATTPLALFLLVVVAFPAVSCADVAYGIAILAPVNGSSVAGVAYFKNYGNEARISAYVTGLAPNQKFGFHIHEFGDISDLNGLLLGEHWNPDNRNHSCPPDDGRHMGDLGNLISDNQGNAVYDEYNGYVVLSGPKGVIGRGISVSAVPDDCDHDSEGTKGRLAQGIIGVAHPRT